MGRAQQFPPEAIIFTIMVMEHQQFPSFQVIFSIIVVLTVISLKILFKKSSTKQPKLPPGPKKLPFIGNLNQLFIGSTVHDRVRDLGNKYGGILHLQLGELSTVIISTPEIAKHVLKTHDLTFAQRPFLLTASILLYDKDIAYAPYGDYWREMRKLCTLELLSTKRVRSFRSIREEQVTKLISDISSAAAVRQPFNISAALLSLAYTIISSVTLVSKYKDDEKLISTVKEATKTATGFSIAELFPSIKFLAVITGLRSRIEKLSRDADRVMDKIIEEHRARRKESRNEDDYKPQDFLDVLLNFQEDNNLGYPITDESIKSIVLDNLIGGSETSSTTVSWAMSEMMKYPRTMQKAQAEVRKVLHGNVDEGCLQELQYLKLVIKETLRLHPAPPLLKRESREDCVIDGYDIPAKTRVLVNAYAIGKDPRYWTDPETFYPERFLENDMDLMGANPEYIPFGAGRRMCPGVLFGMANVELMLAALLYHFDWELPGGKKGEDIDMSEAVGATVRRKHDLVLIPIPYLPVPPSSTEGFK